MTEYEARQYIIDVVGLSDNIIDAILNESGQTNEMLAENLMSKAEAFRMSPEDLRENLKEFYPDAFSDLKPADYTDVGNAKIIQRRYGDRLRYCKALGWLVYKENSGAWELDEAAAKALCIKFTDEMLTDAKRQYLEMLNEAVSNGSKNPHKEIPEDLKKYYNHALASRSRQKIESMLSLAAADLTIELSELDAEPDLINTAAGVYDFRTGTMHPHSPEFYCRHCAPFTPSDDGAEIWESFLDLITEDNADLKKYLQLNLGMCATGNVSAEDLKICIGDGRNGKSTLFKAISKVLDSYSVYVTPDLLLKADNSARSENLKSVLIGKRLAICGEPDKESILSEKAVKQIASNEGKITIKRLYKDPEDVTPTHHVCLFTNFLPKIRNSTDKAIQRRIKVIPFNATMPTGDAEILDYASDLVNQAGGAILKWLLDGATEWYAANFKIKTPEIVKQASEAYMLREDWLQNFIDEYCIVSDNATVRPQQLFDAYKKYAEDRNEYVRRQSDFNEVLQLKGFKQYSKGGHVKIWQGIGLLQIPERTPFE